MKTYDIQELIELSGIPRRTVYFYTQQGIIQPPQGAGLAARYGEVHLLRLRLVPVLRRNGMRLDEIRNALNRMSEEEMLQKLSQAASQASPIIREQSPQILQESRLMIQYELPKGIKLLIPADLTSEDREKIHEFVIRLQNQMTGVGRMEQA